MEPARVHICDRCGKPFAQAAWLHRHQQRKTACTPPAGPIIPVTLSYCCTYCSRALSSKSNLDRHLTTCKAKKLADTAGGAQPTEPALAPTPAGAADVALPPLVLNAPRTPALLGPMMGVVLMRTACEELIERLFVGMYFNVALPQNHCLSWSGEEPLVCWSGRPCFLRGDDVGHLLEEVGMIVLAQLRLYLQSAEAVDRGVNDHLGGYYAPEGRWRGAFTHARMLAIARECRATVVATWRRLGFGGALE